MNRDKYERIVHCVGEGRIVYFHATKSYEGAKVLSSLLDGYVWSVHGRFTPG